MRPKRTRPIIVGAEEYITLSDVLYILQKQVRQIKNRMKFLKERGEKL